MNLVFLRKNCPDCEDLKWMFDFDTMEVEVYFLPEEGARYTDMDSEDEEAMAEADWWNVEGTPSLVTEDEVLYGPDEVEEIIGYLEDLDNG